MFVSILLNELEFNLYVLFPKTPIYKGVFQLALLDFIRYGKFVSEKPLMDGVVIYYFFKLQAISTKY